MDGFLEVICALIVGFVLIIGSRKLLPLLANKHKDEEDVSDDCSKDSESVLTAIATAGAKKKGTKKPPSRQREKSKLQHPWLLCSLKEHSNDIMDMQFSSHGKYLATCAQDRAVMLWPVKQFKEQQPRCSRFNIEYDYASHISWSPDNHALLVARHTDARLQVLKLAKKPDGMLGNAQVALDFDKTDGATVAGCGVSAGGRFIMSCSEQGLLTIYDLKGAVLTQKETLHGSVQRALLSPCGNFVLTAGFTPDVKVWEVVFNKSGDFERLHRAYELGGHTASILDVGVSPDATRMLTVSKDGTWILFNTNVEYRLGQSPQKLSNAAFAERSTLQMSCAALSPDGSTIAVSAHNTVHVYSAQDAVLMATVPALHPGAIRRLLFDPTSKLLLSAGDKQVRVLHNVPGWKLSAKELKIKLDTCKNASMKDRLRSQLQEANDTLAMLDD